MKQFDWNEKKNQWLKKERGISFEKVVEVLKRGEIGLIDDPEEEKEVWAAFENTPHANIEQRKKELQAIAKATLREKVTGERNQKTE